jgi:hypothetical protein
MGDTAAPPATVDCSDTQDTIVALGVPERPVLPFINPGSGNVPVRAEVAPVPVRPPTPAELLTLEQYASLCVELERCDGRVGAVLARYRLTDLDKAALDRHYQAAFAQRPEEWQAFQRARATYEAWLGEPRVKQ